MANEKLRVSVKLPVSPEQLFESWLDSRQHSGFTGSEAKIEPRVGGRHTAWDGYIEGTTLALEPHRRIVQSWRTSDFPPGSRDSRLELLIKAAPGGSELTLLHSEIPPGQGSDYESGWHDYYFEPMKAYFAARVAKMKAPSAKKKPAASKPSARKKPAARTKAKVGSSKRR